MKVGQVPVDHANNRGKGALALIVVGGFLSVLLIVLLVFLRDDQEEVTDIPGPGSGVSEPSKVPLSDVAEEWTGFDVVSTEGLIEGEIGRVIDSMAGFDVGDPVEGGEFHLQGLLTDARTGLPISGGVVVAPAMNLHLLQDETMTVVGEATSGEDGFWELKISDWKADPDAANRSVVASAENYATKVYHLKPGQLSGEEKIKILLEQAGTISGRVVDATGQGIEGASVGWHLLGYTTIGVAGEFASSMTTTGADGSFALERLPVGMRLHLPVQAAGYISKGAGPFSVGESDVEITLERGGSAIYGRVLDLEGNPARVDKVMALNVSDRAFGLPQLRFLVTHESDVDGEGGFRIENLGGGTYFVAASMRPLQANDVLMGPQGRADIAWMRVELAPQTEEEITLQFREPQLLKGRVIDRDTGDGVGGVVISPTWIIPPNTRPEGSVISDHDGHFSLKIASDSQYRGTLHLSTPEGWVHVPEQYGRNVNQIQYFSDESGEISEVIIEVARGILVRGIVVEGDGVTPVANLTPRVYQIGGRDFAATTTDATGNFRFYGGNGMDYGIVVEAPHGFARATVFVGEEAPEPVVLSLESYAEISGTVRDQEDQPVMDVLVTASYMALRVDGRGSMSNSVGIPVSTNESGYYYIDKVPPTEVRVRLRPDTIGDAHAPPPPLELNLKPGEYYREADFVLETSIPLEGKVVDEEGNPLAGARLNVHSIDHVFVQNGILTDDEGVFVITRAPRHSPLTMTISLDGYMSIREEGIPHGDFPVVFTMQRTMELELRVVDGVSGEPVPHYLYLLGEQRSRYGGFPGQEVRDPQGRTKISGFLPGRELTIHVVDVVDGNKVGSRRGMTTHTPDTSGEGIVEVAINEMQSISGRVLQHNERGERVPTPDVQVMAVRDRMSGHFYLFGPQHAPEFHRLAFANPRMKTREDGSFNLDGLDPGLYTLHALGENPPKSGRANVMLPSGENIEDVEILLSSGGRIRFTVIDREGEPLAGARFRHIRHNSQPGSSVESTHQTNEQGQYVLTDVLQGHHSIVLDHHPYQMHETVMYEEGDEELEVTMDFTGRVHLSGVLTLNGRPFSMNDRFSFMTGDVRSDEMGFRNLAGKYSVWLRPGDYRFVVWRQPAGQVRLGEVTITPEPGEQEHDFIITEAVGDVALVFPDEDDFEGGVVTISKTDGSEGYHGIAASVTMTEVTHRIPNLPVQPLRATFRSHSGRWLGISDIVHVTTDGENLFLIDLDSREPVRIGGWSPQVLSDVYTPLSFNVTQHLTREGVWEVYLDYEGGNEGLMIESVSLLANGSLVSLDAHPGWSGFTRHDHVYVLEVPELVAGVTYEVVARVRASGDQDSRGSVWLRRE